MLSVILSSFWTWAGTVILVAVAAYGATEIIKALRKPRRKVRVSRHNGEPFLVEVENAESFDIITAVDALSWKEIPEGVEERK